MARREFKVVGEPVTIDPNVSEPVVSTPEPVTIDPSVSDPNVSEPVTTEPSVSDPVVSTPELTITPDPPTTSTPEPPTAKSYLITVRGPVRQGIELRRVFYDNQHLDITTAQKDFGLNIKDINTLKINDIDAANNILTMPIPFVLAPME